MLLNRVEGRRGSTGRHYVRSDTGQRVPSVTTVVSLTPKPYLMNWVVKLAAEWAADHVRTLAGLTREERVDRIKAETRELREAGAKRGTALHTYAEDYLWMGGPEPVTRPEQAVAAIVRALAPQVLHTEAMVWNGTVGYAGTVDGIWAVEWDGLPETWLVDWKTSKSRSVEWGLQMEAYKRAETICLVNGTEVPMPFIDRCVALWVPYDRPWQVVELTTGDQEWEAFQHSLQVLAWQDARKMADVFGPCLTSEKTSTEGNGQ